MELCGVSLETPLGDTSLGDALMAPTLIYVRSVLALLEQIEVCAIAHITGGGLPGNIRRIIPTGLEARIISGRWEKPAVFDWLQSEGGIASDEMLRTFNCGIGLVLVVRADDKPQALKLLEQQGERVCFLGEITTGDRGVVID
jgi:phosphoribosylformylglycinamidine cyclo-ligase